MSRVVPHIVQYQGSKRMLASQILQYMPHKFERCVEPFAGTAAITIATAQTKNVSSFLINDLNRPLVDMLKAAIETPQQLYEDYKRVWEEQFSGDTTEHFFTVRKRFNSGDKSPANMLYLLARCVKGAVRYNAAGEINQSPDKRRHGTKPETILKNIESISGLLKGKTSFYSLDYHEIFGLTKPGDIVYMDPPYQGVSNVRDNRYYAGVPFGEFAESLEVLNKKGVDFLISYDGVCGGKSYGEDLPESLECKKLLLNAGRSTQATLLGKKDVTYEALYVSRGLQKYIDEVPVRKSLLEEVG